MFVSRLPKNISHRKNIILNPTGINLKAVKQKKVRIEAHRVIKENQVINPHQVQIEVINPKAIISQNQTAHPKRVTDRHHPAANLRAATDRLVRVVPDLNQVHTHVPQIRRQDQVETVAAVEAVEERAVAAAGAENDSAL
jgi:hypothetical protein